MRYTIYEDGKKVTKYVPSGRPHNPRPSTERGKRRNSPMHWPKKEEAAS
jgi:hypothetical protein